MRILVASLALIALAACSNDDPDTSQAIADPGNPPLATLGDSFVVTGSNQLVTFNRATASTTIGSVRITGLNAGESVAGIDFRPADRQLYALTTQGRIAVINTTTGAATIRATLVADPADTSAPYAGLSGGSFGVDFNPTVDRLRVVSASGQNLRINVDTGATTTDAAINGGSAGAVVTAVAYDNSFAGAGTTTLYDLDTANGMLNVQSPPNNGTLATGVSLGVAALSVSGFDIDGRDNRGFAVLNVGGVRGLYAINLAATSNAATLMGTLNIGEDIRGFAIAPAAAPVAYGLTDDNRLVSFNPTQPNTLTATVALSGLNAGESVIGIDTRPSNGLSYALSSAGRLFTINLATGALTFLRSLAADPADMTAPYAGISGTAFAVDFNPAADRMRVISDTGQSLRINVDTGNTTTDGAINRMGAMPVVTAAAYTNSIAGATATQLFDLDNAGDNLALQNPPNDGTLANTGALGIDIAGDNGFDIAGGANGLALAALRPTAGGPSSIYRINLTTGAATLITGTASTSSVGTGPTGLKDLMIVLR